MTFCVTLAASLAARLGATPMAAFQTCLQVWMTSSLLADGLAVAVQVKTLVIATKKHVFLMTNQNSTTKTLSTDSNAVFLFFTFFEK